MLSDHSLGKLHNIELSHIGSTHFLLGLMSSTFLASECCCSLLVVALMSVVIVASTSIWYPPWVLRSWALGPHFSFLSCPLCTYTITWPRLTWPLTCTTEPPCQELHCSLLSYVFLLFSSYGSLWPPLFVTPLFCDAYCLWLYCSLLLYA